MLSLDWILHYKSSLTPRKIQNLGLGLKSENVAQEKIACFKQRFSFFKRSKGQKGQLAELQLYPHNSNLPKISKNIYHCHHLKGDLGGMPPTANTFIILIRFRTRATWTSCCTTPRRLQRSSIGQKIFYRFVCCVKPENGGLPL